MLSAEVYSFGTGLEILHQCGERVKIKSQKVLGAKSYVSKSYKKKIGQGGYFDPPPSHLLPSKILLAL